MSRLLNIASLIIVTIGLVPATAQPPATTPAQTSPPATGVRAPRPPAPTRDPHTAGYVTATELSDGAIPSPKADGNFILTPTHPASPEMTAQESVPHGTIYNFTMESADSKFYPGVARDANPPGQAGPPPGGGPRVVSNHPAPYTRKVAVYVPKQYVAGTAAPFIVGADGPDPGLFVALDNLIAQHRVPVMIAVAIGNGSGDGPGSERGLEYDTMSGKYAEFVEAEVLPLVEKQYNVKLTKDPDGRATMGGSSGGSVALGMAWFHPDLYHRVLTYSGTYVNNQFPVDPQLPHGAWELHEHLIPDSPVKPIRIWMEVGEKDLHFDDPEQSFHNWPMANKRMAAALKAKGYDYHLSFALGAMHCDNRVITQTLPESLEWTWKGYPR